jgi:6-phosphogluconolactonase (cycloisomerase 2 family)
MQRFTPSLLFPGALVCALFAGLTAFAQTFTATASSASQLPKPKFLYTTDYKGGKVNGYRVNPSTGALTPTGQIPQWAHWGPTRVASDTGGYRLYVINQGSTDINAYFIYRNNGYIYGVPGSPFPIGHPPTDVKVHPSGDYVYVTAQKSSGTSWVYAFAVRSNGSLKPVPGSPFSAVNWAQALVIDPQGKYLYVSNSPVTPYPSTSEVDAFSISPTDGALTPLPGSPYTEPNSQYCANGAWDVALHPSGNFLILPNMCEGLVVYRVDRSTGTLTLVNGSPFAVPYPPYPDVESIAVDPAGEYIWISTQFCDSGCSQSTDTWKFNTTTGIPTYLESAGNGCGMLTRADPSGKFVYEIGDTISNQICGAPGPPAIWGFSVNRSSGALNNLGGSPWASPNSDWYFTDGLAITP